MVLIDVFFKFLKQFLEHLLYHNVMKNYFKLTSIASSVKFYKKVVLCCIVLVSFWQQAIAQGSANLLTISSSYLAPGFKGNGNFNALIFGNLTSSGGDTEGRLGVKGDFNFPNGGYSVGAGSIGPKSPDNTDNFVVNGNFNNGVNNWGLIGNFVYNTKSPGAALPSLNSPGASVTSGKVDHIKFSTDLLTQYRTISSSLNSRVNTGTPVQVHSYDPIEINANKLGVNVFDLTLPSNPFSGKTIDITVGAEASAVVINVLNTTVDINGGSLKINGTDTKTAGGKVIFNFPNATSISLSSYAFIGSFLAPYADLTGSGGSINGQAIIGGNVGQSNGFEFHNIYFTGSFDSALPVNLTLFTATGERSSVNLTWATATETNSSRFDIERSLNGKNWASIGSVASHGESNQLKNYSFIDKSPAQGENLYRLKMIDLDDTFAYSRIQSVTVEAGTAMTIFPNPASDRILINDNFSVKQVAMTDMSGRKIYQADQISSAGIDCKNFLSGMYVVTITRTNGAIDSHKILIRK